MKEEYFPLKGQPESLLSSHWLADLGSPHVRTLLVHVAEDFHDVTS